MDLLQSSTDWIRIVEPGSTSRRTRGGGSFGGQLSWPLAKLLYQLMAASALRVASPALSCGRKSSKAGRLVLGSEQEASPLSLA